MMLVCCDMYANDKPMILQPFFFFFETSHTRGFSFFFWYKCKRLLLFFIVAVFFSIIRPSVYISIPNKPDEMRVVGSHFSNQVYNVRIGPATTQKAMCPEYCRTICFWTDLIHLWTVVGAKNQRKNKYRLEKAEGTQTDVCQVTVSG